MLSIPTFLRLASFAGVFLLSYNVSRVNWLIAFMSIGSCHYLLGLFYSRKKLVAGFKAGGRYLWISLFFIGLIIGLYLIRFNIVVLHGIHHVFTESYIDKFFKKGRLAHQSLISGLLKFSIHAFIYMSVLHYHPCFQFISRRMSIFTVFLLLLVYLGVFFFYTDRHQKESMMRDFSPMIMGLALIALSLETKISFTQYGMYHFGFWAFLPLFREEKEKRPQIFTFLALTGVFLMPYLFLGLRYNTSVEVLVDAWPFKLFLLISYLHYITSTISSPVIPHWLVRLTSPLRESHQPEPQKIG